MTLKGTVCFMSHSLTCTLREGLCKYFLNGKSMNIFFSNSFSLLDRGAVEALEKDLVNLLNGAYFC